MTASPATLAKQITTARARNITPVYSTSTGDAPKVYTEVLWDDFCFICSRATDHAGEDHSDAMGNPIPQRDACWTDEWTKPGPGNTIIRYVEHNTRVHRA